MQYRIEAEKFKGSVISRVFFKGQPEVDHFVDGEISARRGTSDNDDDDDGLCVAHTVYIKVRRSFCTHDVQNIITHI